MIVISVFLFLYMKQQYRQINRHSKAIEEFNRKCAEERERYKIDSAKKAPKRVHNYIIDTRNVLGTGTFSSVYKGKDVHKGKDVAVKVMELKTIQKMGIKELFWEQLNIIQQLRHPNIVTCLEYFRTPNNCYTVYEFCQGGDLASIISKGPLGEKEDLHLANNMIKDIFQGLLYLETMSIIHRDIKAANILVSKGKAKIGDFGFATRCKSDFKDASIGSPAYMSPEGLLDNIYGSKTDVWAFGILVYEILHGYSPFHLCENEKELKKQILIPVNWDQFKASLPSNLKRMVLKCLKVNSQQRPTFSELLNDQYIQKLYQSIPLVKSHQKSNYSKVTSDSDKNFQSFSLSVIPHEEPIKDINVQEHHGMITIGKARSLEKHFSLQTDFELQEEKNCVISMKKQKECQKEQDFFLQKLKVETFWYTPENVSAEDWLQVFSIFNSSLEGLESINLEDSEYQQFKNMMIQLSIQLYWRFKISSGKELQSFKKLLNKTSLNFGEVPELKSLSKENIQTVFSLIKIIQNLIDKQDLYTEKSKLQTSNLVNCGNNLILCYRLISSLIKKQPFSGLLQFSKTKDLESSEQFYIWLYQIELEAMQLQNETKNNE